MSWHHAEERIILSSSGAVIGSWHLETAMIGTRTDRDAALIAAHVEPHPARSGAAEWRLKERGVPVWAIIGTLLPDGSNVDQVASDYGISREAVEAARAYYRQNQALIDARLAANRAA